MSQYEFTPHNASSIQSRTIFVCYQFKKIKKYGNKAGSTDGAWRYDQQCLFYGTAQTDEALLQITNDIKQKTDCLYRFANFQIFKPPNKKEDF